jgi:hypothetical protein
MLHQRTSTAEYDLIVAEWLAFRIVISSFGSVEVSVVVGSVHGKYIWASVAVIAFLAS